MEKPSDLNYGLSDRYPPIALLPSLSRFMKDGIGPGRTRADHAAVARQLYAGVARVARARALESIIGTDELSDTERASLQIVCRILSRIGSARSPK